MRRFGLDIKNNKNNNGGKQKDLESLKFSLEQGKSEAELEEIRQKRLARFGEVDPDDLKSLRKRDKKRVQKMNKKQL